MRTELHKLCNFATGSLQQSLSDDVNLASYLYGMTTKEEAGRRIKAARLKKGLRLEDVCSQIPELIVSRLSNWEQGRNMVGVDEAKKLAPILGVSASYLLTIEDEPGDTRERALIDLYRQSDVRGKDEILHIAERQSAYAISRDDDDHQDTGTG